jgi:DNA-directed RNA polymerase subunit RPC12/RpoP
MVKSCHKCGTKSIDDESLFCNKCGTKFIQNPLEKKDNSCPNCGAKILDKEALFCNKCGSQFSTNTTIMTKPVVTQSSNNKYPTKSDHNYEPNWVLILAFGFGLLSIFVPPLLIIIVIASAIAVYYDAKTIRAGEQTIEEATMNTHSWSPLSWGLMVLFLWIIGLPLYLFKRREIFYFNYGLSKDGPNYRVKDSVKKKSSGSLLGLALMAIGAVGLLLIIAPIIAAFVFGMAGNSPSSSPTVQPSPISTSPIIDVKNNGKTTSKPTVIATATQPSVPTEIELAIGQMASNPERQVTAYSAQKVSSYTVTFSNYPITTQAKSGNIFIFIDTEVKNIGSDRIYASAGDFSMSDSEGNRYDPEMYTGDDSLGYFKELYRNQKARGKVLFEIPLTAKNLKLYYDFGNLFSGTKLASWTIN